MVYNYAKVEGNMQKKEILCKKNFNSGLLRLEREYFYKTSQIV
jgi:hypothetical protein